jgi:hypothetical protein
MQMGFSQSQIDGPLRVLDIVAAESTCSLDADQSVMWAFHAARTNCASAELSAPSRVRKSVFSAVTKRFSRTTDGLANPATAQFIS